MKKYTREDLIAICEKGIVPVSEWGNRDTPDAQVQLYKAYGLLKAGCDFNVIYSGDRHCNTDERTIWLYIYFPSFGTYDHGGPNQEDHFYLPTFERLAACEGTDWY